MSEFKIDRSAPIPGDRQMDRKAFYARRRRLGLGALGIVGGGGVLIAGGVALFSGLRDGVNTQRDTMTVCDKDRTRDENGTLRYTVDLADSEGNLTVAEVKKTIIVGGFRQDAAEFYAGLDEDVTYDLTLSGVRVAIAEEYQNIVDATRTLPQPEVNYCDL